MSLTDDLRKIRSFGVNWIHVRIGTVLTLVVFTLTLLVLLTVFHQWPDSVIVAAANAMTISFAVYFTNDYRDGDLLDPTKGAPWNGINDVFWGVLPSWILCFLVLLFFITRKLLTL